MDCRAVALAPIVDRGLSWFTVKYKFKSQGKVSHPNLHGVDDDNGEE